MPAPYRIDIANGLNTAFTVSPFALLTLNSLTVALHRETDGRIILIDSHSRGIQGEPLDSGNAVFIPFDQLEGVCLYSSEMYANLSPVEFNVINGANIRQIDCHSSPLNEAGHTLTVNITPNTELQNAENVQNITKITSIIYRADMDYVKSSHEGVNTSLHIALPDDRHLNNNYRSKVKLSS